MRLKPDYAKAFYHRGNTLLSLKRPEDALGSYDRALKLKPDYADALYNCGVALQSLKRPEQALARYDRALQLKPEDAEALNNRGNALLDLRRPEEALISYDRALSLKPDYVDALHNRGLALLKVKRPEDAMQSYARLLELAPDYHFAKGKLLHAKMSCCDWGQLIPITASIEKDIRAGKQSAEPFGYQAIQTRPKTLGAALKYMLLQTIHVRKSNFGLENDIRKRKSTSDICRVSSETRQPLF